MIEHSTVLGSSHLMQPAAAALNSYCYLHRSEDRPGGSQWDGVGIVGEPLAGSRGRGQAPPTFGGAATCALRRAGTPVYFLGPCHALDSAPHSRATRADLTRSWSSAQDPSPQRLAGRNARPPHPPLPQRPLGEFAERLNPRVRGSRASPSCAWHRGCSRTSRDLCQGAGPR